MVLKTACPTSEIFSDVSGPKSSKITGRPMSELNASCSAINPPSERKADPSKLSRVAKSLIRHTKSSRPRSLANHPRYKCSYKLSSRTTFRTRNKQRFAKGMEGLVQNPSSSSTLNVAKGRHRLVLGGNPMGTKEPKSTLR